MNKKKVAALAFIPFVGVLAYANSAFAASTTASSAVSSTVANVAQKFMHGHKDSTQFATDLATVLGLNAADVKAKLDAGQTPYSIITSTGKTEADIQAQLKTLRENELKTRLATEVASGKITQSQADQMITTMATHSGGPGMHERGRRDNTQFAKDLASILGTSETDIKAKLDAGTKPDDIITASGKNVADVMTQLKALKEADVKAKIEANVASGKITQAQADQMITNLGKGHSWSHYGFMGMIRTTTPNTPTSTSTQ